jgi:hypothetical protein
MNKLEISENASNEEGSMLCNGRTFNSCAESGHDKFALNLGASTKI